MTTNTNTNVNVNVNEELENQTRRLQRGMIGAVVAGTATGIAAGIITRKLTKNLMGDGASIACSIGAGFVGYEAVAVPASQHLKKKAMAVLENVIAEELSDFMDC